MRQDPADHDGQAGQDAEQGEPDQDGQEEIVLEQIQRLGRRGRQMVVVLREDRVETDGGQEAHAAEDGPGERPVRQPAITGPHLPGQCHREQHQEQYGQAPDEVEHEVRRVVAPVPGDDLRAGGVTARRVRGRENAIATSTPASIPDAGAHLLSHADM